MDKALVSLTFDDGLVSQFDNAVPILEQFEFRATFFLVANTDTNHTDGFEHPHWPRISWDDERLRNILARGHEIGSHSVTHRCERTPESEAMDSKEWIEERLGIPIPSYCYPFGDANNANVEAVRTAGYQQARSFKGRGGDYYDPEKPPETLLDLDCREVLNGENVANWIRSGHWHIVGLHGIGEEPHSGWHPISTAEFARQMSELAKVRDSGKVEVVTFNEGAERLRQQ